MITLTPAAKEQISKLCQENDCYAVKLGVKGGGCAGFEYEWSTANEDEVDKVDELFECAYGNFIIKKILSEQCLTFKIQMHSLLVAVVLV
jgi:Fe-S cluster assembly iron-binding protein IscA